MVASAICAGVEAAIFAVTRTKIQALVEKGSASAKALLDMKSNLHRPISAIVILTNLSNIVGSIWVSTVAAREFGSQWVGLVGGILTFLIIIFSEIIPKTLGEKNALPISLAAVRPVQFVTMILTPLLVVIDLIVGPLATRTEAMVEEAELRALTFDGVRSGTIDEKQGQLIAGALALRAKTAKQIMTPRVSLTSMPGDHTLAELRDEIADSEHSRIVVTGDSIDDVLGVALKDHLLGVLVRGNQDRRLREFTEEVVTIPKSRPASELLESFRDTRQHLHIVLDEHGGLAGVVTLEDVLEEMTGEILDETDRAADLAGLARAHYQRRKAR